MGKTKVTSCTIVGIVQEMVKVLGLQVLAGDRNVYVERGRMSESCEAEQEVLRRLVYSIIDQHKKMLIRPSMAFDAIDIGYAGLAMDDFDDDDVNYGMLRLRTAMHDGRVVVDVWWENSGWHGEDA